MTAQEFLEFVANDSVDTSSHKARQQVESYIRMAKKILKKQQGCNSTVE